MSENQNGDHFFIDDGYTRDFKIDAVPGLHPALSGTFRPVLPDERIRLRVTNLGSRDGGGCAFRTAKVVADHLLSWDAKQFKVKKAASGAETGEIEVVEAPCKAEWIVKLQADLFSKLENIVLGYEPAEAIADAKN